MSNDHNPPNAPPQPPSNANANANNPTANKSTTNTNTTRDPSPNNASLPSRIHSSATSLAKNAFFAPSAPADISNTLSAVSRGNKAASPGASGTGTAGQSLYYTEGSPGSSAAGGGGGGGGVGIPGEDGTAEGFRSNVNAGAVPGPLAEEEGFQHGYGYDYAPGPRLGYGYGYGYEHGLGHGNAYYGNDNVEELGLGGVSAAISEDKGKGKAPLSSSDFENAWQTATATTDTNQDHQDGAAVLSLLSSPSFNPDFPDHLQHQGHQADESLIETDLSDYAAPELTRLTATEKQILDSFRRQDPQQQPQPRPHRLTSSSLIPDIGSFLNDIPAQHQGQEGSDATALRDAVLTGLPGAHDWVSVEERYQDEVWGYLKPALEAAAKELEEKKVKGGEKGDERAEDGPAVARLKMILRHMGA